MGKRLLFGAVGVILTTLLGAFFYDYIYPPVRAFVVETNWTNVRMKSSRAVHLAAQSVVPYAMLYVIAVIVVFQRRGFGRYLRASFRSLLSFREPVVSPGIGPFVLTGAAVELFTRMFVKALAGAFGLQDAEPIGGGALYPG